MPIIAILIVIWVILPFVFIPLYVVTQSQKNKLASELELAKRQNQNLRELVVSERKERTGESDASAVIAEPMSEAIPEPEVVVTCEAVTKTESEEAEVADFTPDPVTVPAEAVIGEAVTRLEHVTEGPATEPVIETATEPVIETATEPVVGPAFEPVSTPVLKPVSAPASMPAEVARAKAVPVADAYEFAGFDNAVKKLDPMRIVFGIGVTLTILAGLVFATTTWSIMSSVAKMLSVLVMAAIFMTISLIAGNKLKLVSTSIAFYAIGSTAMALSAMTYGYFEVCDKNINPLLQENAGVYFLTFFILGIMMCLGYFIYQGRKVFAHVTFNILGISIMFLLSMLISNDYYRLYIPVEVIFIMLISQLIIKIKGEYFVKSPVYTIGFGSALSLVAGLTLAFVRESSFLDLDTSEVFFKYILWSIVAVISLLVAILKKKNDTLTLSEELSLLIFVIIAGVTVMVRMLQSLFEFAESAEGYEELISAVIVLFITIIIGIINKLVGSRFKLKWCMFAVCYAMVGTFKAAFLIDFFYEYRMSVRLSWAFIAMAVFSFYMACEFTGIGRKLAFTAAGLSFTLAYWTQQIFEFKGDFASELFMLILVPLCIYLYFFVWRNNKETKNWIVFGCMTFAVVVEMVSLVLEYEPGDGIIVVKLLIVSAIAIACILLGSISNRISYLILAMSCSFLMVCYLRSENLENVIISEFMYILAFTFTGYGIYHVYKNNCTMLMAIPVLTVVVAYGELVSLFYDSNLDNIVPYFMELIMAVLFIVSGMLLHRKLVDFSEGKRNINWISIGAVLFVFPLMDGYTDGQIKFGFFMFAVYLLTYNKWLKVKPAIAFNIIAGLILRNLWSFGDFFEIPRIIALEWYMLGLLLFVLFCKFVVFRGLKFDMGWWLFAIAILYTVIAFMKALYSEDIVDVLKLAIFLLVLLVMSFVLKRKRWFIFSSIALVIVVVKLTWALWVSIAWWAYLLAAGLILISVAAKHEYNKRNGIVRKGIYKRLTADWKI